MKLEAELRKDYKISLLDGLIELVFLKEEKEEGNNTRLAELVKEDIYGIFTENPEKVFTVLVDTLPLGKTAYISKDAREIYKELAYDRRFRKIAVVGKTEPKNEVLQFLLILINLFTRKISWFGNREEAILWLKN